MKNFYIFLVAILVTGLGFGQTSSDAWINEIHYDDGGGDINEAVEIVIADVATYPLINWTVILYNGDNGTSYSTINYSTGATTSTDSGYTIVWKIVPSSMQNGAPDGLALVYNGSTVVQFLSYEGSFTATNGIAIGQTSTDIGVNETGSTPDGQSLQLNGTGTVYSDFAWQAPATATAGNINTGQIFGAGTDTSVEFFGTPVSVSEGVSTTDLTFSITNPDVINATSFNVALTGGDGDASDINNYTTQLVTFPANTSANQTLTITVTDDMVFEGDETLTFTIQNVTGGNNAASGSNSAFVLTITENDVAPPQAPVWSEPFNNNSQYAVTIGGEGNDGSQDYFQITDGVNISESYLGGNGTFFACQDIDDGGWVGSASPSQLTWTGINIGAFSNLDFKGSFASIGGGIDAADFVLIEYQIDSGGWQDLLAFKNDGTTSNTNFLEDTDFIGPGDGTLLTSTFNEFEKSIGSTGTLLDLRITVSLNSGGEEIAFDDFKIEGVYNGLTYIDGAWSPSAPDGSTGSDNALIVSGEYTLAASVSLNNVFVNPGAAVNIPSSYTLTASSLNLESNSGLYSSLILDGSLAGAIVDNVTYRRFVNNHNIALPGGNDLIASPLTGLTFFDFAGSDPENSNLYNNPTPPNDDQIEYLFGPFDNGNSDMYLLYSIGLDGPFGSPDQNNLNYDNDKPLTTGKGFRAATNSLNGTTLTFRGGVNTGSVTTTDFDALGNDPIDKWNLVGNPYPSYMDAQLFLTENGGAIDQTVLNPNFNAIYGYNDNTDGTTSRKWTIINSIQNTNIDIAPGQGFFVASNNTGQLNFTPAMRLSSGGDDFIQGRGANSVFHATLKLSKSNDSFNTDFYFTNDATQGLNPGYDAGMYGGSATPFSLYSHLVQDNQGIPFAIQALGETDYNNVTIALGVNAAQGEQITFSISETTLPTTVNVYLDDTVLSTSTLLNSGDYLLTPTSALSGSGRFFLRFAESALSISQNNLNNLNIYASQIDRTVVITGQLLETTTANVYDLQGRLVTSRLLNSDSISQSIDVSSLQSGIYIVQLSNDTYHKTKKVIIY